jgi:hypothetical protein
MSDALRASDVNIEALFCVEGPEDTTVQMVVDDHETAKIVLRDIAPVKSTEVIALDIKNKPGVIASFTRILAGAHINIHHIYATAAGKTAMLYLHVSDTKKAMEVLG